MFFSFGQKWGEDTTNFFVSDFVKHTGDLTSVFVPQMFVGLVIVWALAILIMFGGIRKGVGTCEQNLFAIITGIIWCYGI